MGIRAAQTWKHCVACCRSRGLWPITWSPKPPTASPTRCTTKLHIEVEVTRNPACAVKGLNVVVTSGPILKHPQPVIEGTVGRKPALGSLVDFDSYWQGPALAEADKLATDDKAQMAYYRQVGYFRWTPEPYADLGEIVAGIKPGRQSKTERTMAINLGLALDNMATAAVGLTTCPDARDRHGVAAVRRSIEEGLSRRPKVFYHSFQYQAKSWHRARRVSPRWNGIAGSCFRESGSSRRTSPGVSKRVVRCYNGRGRNRAHQSPKPAFAPLTEAWHPVFRRRKMATRRGKHTGAIDTGAGRDGKMDGRTSLDRLQAHCKWEMPPKSWKTIMTRTGLAVVVAVVHLPSPGAAWRTSSLRCGAARTKRRGC